jgi:hypothetical protein
MLSPRIKADGAPSKNGSAMMMNRVLETDAPLLAAAEEIPEGRRVAWRGDDEEFPDPRRHQRGQRIINHRLVVYRQELFALRQRNRVQAGAGTARQDDSFPWFGQ